ncbi:MAG: SDR family NAD(P)-dependent oxidoreductase [Pseudomonadota bacterium]
MELNNTLAAVVTGGGSGLGESTARALASKGVKVAIFDVNEEGGQRVASEIGGVFAKVDVSDSASVAAGLEVARAANGQEQICVNCAGIAPAAKTVDRDGNPHDASLFAKAIGVNLIGTFNVASQCAAGMAVQDPVSDDGERGVIINTASVAAFDGQIGQIAGIWESADLPCCGHTSRTHFLDDFESFFEIYMYCIATVTTCFLSIDNLNIHKAASPHLCLI